MRYHFSMPPLSLYYPVTPFTVNRSWGVIDELYRKFGFVRHNGVDLALADGQDIYAPMDGIVTLVGNQPNGSGVFLCLLSRNAYQFPDGKECRVELTFMHLSETLVREGTRVSVGDKIARGGHTGKTSGPHLHLAPKRVKKTLFGYRDLDRNDANNTFDPAPYWNGSFAQR
jgi:murein DD-endopeptidase MepM/ murein hydrolase activator NlpD